MHIIKIPNYSLLGRDHAILLVGATVLVRTYCLHLYMACEERPRMLLQAIHCPIPEHIMNPHHFEHLISCIKEY